MTSDVWYHAKPEETYSATNCCIGQDVSCVMFHLVSPTCQPLHHVVTEVVVAAGTVHRQKRVSTRWIGTLNIRTIVYGLMRGKGMITTRCG